MLLLGPLFDWSLGELTSALALTAPLKFSSLLGLLNRCLLLGKSAASLALAAILNFSGGLATTGSVILFVEKWIVANTKSEDRGKTSQANSQHDIHVLSRARKINRTHHQLAY